MLATNHLIASQYSPICTKIMRALRNWIPVRGNSDGKDDRSQVPPQDSDRPASEGQIWPLRDVRAGNDPPAVHDDDPRHRDDEQNADEKNQRPPGEFPDSELDRKRPAAMAAGTCHWAAVLWNGRQARGAREQSRNIPAFLPARHALAPDQRLRRHRAVRDELS